MQTVGSQLTTVLQARERDLITVYEIYASDYQPAATGFDPRVAEQTFSETAFTLPFGPVVYRREVLQGPSIKKSMGKEFNSITIRFSNVSRYMSAWVLANEVEQKRLVVRVVSRSVAAAIGNNISILSNSAILGPGYRCDKPDGFNRSVGTISAKPDIASIEAQIPPRRFQGSCPLEFKGPECLGSEAIGAKSAAYQAALTCNFTFTQCATYANEEFFQGIQIVPITSSFVHKSNESFFKKILNILPGISRKSTTVNNSLYDGTPYGNPIPLIFGRWYKVLLPLQFQDLGTAINFLMAACRGTISAFINLRTHSLNFSPPQGVTAHLGEYGGVGTQTQDTLFPPFGFFSKLAYITGFCTGTQIDVEDPAPEISAVIAGNVPESIYFDVDHDGTGKLAAGTGGVTTPGSSAAGGDDSHCALYVKVTMQDLIAPAEINSVDFNGAPPTWTNVVNATVGGSNQLTKTGGTSYWDAGANSVETIPGDSAGYVTFKSEHGGATTTEYGVGLGLTHQITTPGFYNDIDYLMVLYGKPFGADSRFIDIWELGIHKARITSPPVTTTEVFKINRAANGIVTYLRDGNLIYTSTRTCVPGPGRDWTDNPVDHTRFVLTEPALMGNDDTSIDDFLSAYAAAWNTGAIKDDSNAERCLLPNTEITKAGVDYKRYTSTGLFGPLTWEATRTQIPAGVPARELLNVGAGGNAIGEYEFFDPATPPTSLSTLLAYRKRYTCNIEVSEVRKAVDFIYDTIFPTNRGFFRWTPLGKTVIDNERPADWTTLKVASIATATTLTVRDVLPWKNILGSPYLLEGKIRIGIEYSWQYDTSAIRAGATGFAANDVGKFALQLDNKTVWQLTAVTPTWTQITVDTSEVRRVTLAEYSSLGNAITLAASAAGGPSTAVSGGTLAGGSTTVQSSGTVTITGTLANGSSITVTIDGVASVLDLVPGETSAIIGHRMAAVINANPAINEYVEAHAASNVVTIYSKLGVLTLSSALENPHDIGAGITRVMMSFAWKALTYADTTNASILDGTFGWPDASRQSLVNQIKAKHRESVQDFGEQPIVVNDFNHQRKTRKTNPFEVDYSAVDNHNQGSRLSNGLLNKLRDGDQFFNWSKMGDAMLLDEGDVVCVTDSSGPFRNELVRIEDIGIDNTLEVSFIARKYSRLQLSDLAAQPSSLVLPSALTNFQSAPPDIAFNTTDFPPDGLIQTTSGTAGITSIRGGVVFGASIYGQYANVRLIMRAGVVVNEFIAKLFPTPGVPPDTRLLGTFEFLASAEGLYTVELEVCSLINICNTIKPTASIVIVFGSLYAIAQENGFALLQENGDFLEVEH